MTIEAPRVHTFLNREGQPETIPSVGDGATIGVGSDCYPATVIRVEIDRGKFVVVVQNDDYDFDKTTGKNVFTPNPNRGIKAYRLEAASYVDYNDQRNSYHYWHGMVWNEYTERWNKSLRGSVGFGERCHYRDPSF